MLACDGRYRCHAAMSYTVCTGRLARNTRPGADTARAKLRHCWRGGSCLAAEGTRAWCVILLQGTSLTGLHPGGEMRRRGRDTARTRIQECNVKHHYLVQFNMQMCSFVLLGPRPRARGLIAGCAGCVCSGCSCPAVMPACCSASLSSRRRQRPCHRPSCCGWPGSCTSPQPVISKHMCCLRSNPHFQSSMIAITAKKVMLL